ncbi:zinc finger translocation-associated protein-like isoform X2 [Heterodontus francisci]|uniref:zinc finger translocation-associated protein-like isoform X2 n=1 Tax=Heterodontus francisci TaxID=7792 RepID=UPI00355B4E82
MEHKSGILKMEPDTVEVALASMRHSPQQQPTPNRHTAPRIKEERPDLDEASLNCEGLRLARTTLEAGPLTPAEAKNTAKRHSRKSRLPGRDHRRYYQERWKMEYLMDYDCLRHGLICMVCGSALATLKLSTIKRHILQKHQDTMFLTRTEKEVVIATWVEHLLSHRYPQEEPDTLGPELVAAQPNPTPVDPVPAEPALSLEPVPAMPTLSGEAEELPGKGGPPVNDAPARRPGPGCPLGKRVRRYYQERWRTEYLMDYDCLRHGLICMVCGSALATLKLSTIKRHILQKHQASLSLTPTERDVVMATWVEHLLNQSQINIEQQGAGPVHFIQSHVEAQAAAPASHIIDQSYTEQRGAGLAPLNQSHIDRQGAGAVLLNQSDIDIGEAAPALFDQSSFEQRGTGPTRHFNQSQINVKQQGAGSTLPLHQSQVEQQRAERACLFHQSQIYIEQRGAGPKPHAGGVPELSDSVDAGSIVKLEGYPAVPVRVDQLPPPAENSRVLEQRTVQHSPLTRWSSKGVRRYYQERWRFEHLMDYDRWRHGLVCMVCGKSLATLTLSTIKRHILQNHPHSLNFSHNERENILEAWNERALQQDCTAVQLVMPRLGLNWSAGKRPRRYYQEHWRFEYLMDCGQWHQGLVCMVCGKSLVTLSLSTIKRHILQNHPHSLNFSQAERENILEAWGKSTSQQESRVIEPRATEEEEISARGTPAAVTGIPGAESEPCVNTGENPDVEFSKSVDVEWNGPGGGSRSPAEIEVCVEEQELSFPTRTVRGRVPGRDHRRNYQERWRFEYLMDYDRWRHGLVCMVCGSALATLKLSTIKRHILQKHQHTMGFTLAEKVMVVEEWNKKIATIAKMDFWQLPVTGGNGSPPPQHPGGVNTTRR